MSKKNKNNSHAEPILKLRNTLLDKHPEAAEDIHAACKGMYKCAKTDDDPCLKRITKALHDLQESLGAKHAAKSDAPAAKKKGGRPKSRARPKSQARSKSRSKSRTKSRSRR